MAFHNFLKVVQKIAHSGFDRDFREMQETETIDQVQSKDSLAVNEERKFRSKERKFRRLRTSVKHRS